MCRTIPLRKTNKNQARLLLFPFLNQLVLALTTSENLRASVDRSFAWARSDDSYPKMAGYEFRLATAKDTRNELPLYLKKKSLPFSLPDQRIQSDQVKPPFSLYQNRDLI
ncbi:hypothetical protein CQW23_16564 [Capsicum baccatum]|uniref:Uncharacterized protein n=1 Tax=Capsicum baccatum TaxID=33114 RepID=A0A2G2WBI9_CAPBA|nr:hypothetical protein CQW23_16564 [Capsicum baccatum]